MTSTGLFVLDGVIRKPGTDVIIPQGRILFLAVAQSMRVGILGTEDREKDNWFLGANGFKKYADLFEQRTTDGPTIEERTEAQVTRARLRGASVDFLVEPNPDVAAYLMDRGVPVLLFLSPRYSHPDFRPDADRTAKPWDRLVETVNYQTELRVKDSRTDQEPE